MWRVRWPQAPVVVISGAATGLGRKIAERFEEGGFRAHVCDASAGRGRRNSVPRTQCGGQRRRRERLEAGRCLVRRDRREIRPRGRTGQQRRHRRPHGAGREDRAGRLGPYDRCRPERPVLLHAPCRAADPCRGRRLDRQHRVERGVLRLSLAHAVRSLQVGAARIHQDAGDGTGPGGHPRQRHLSGQHQGPAHRRRDRA